MDGIDYNWSGAILLDFVKIVDKCTEQNGVQPAPENQIAIGLTFDKAFHHTTISLTVPRTNVHSQVLVIVDGLTATFHHPSQAVKTNDSSIFMH